MVDCCRQQQKNRDAIQKLTRIHRPTEVNRLIWAEIAIYLLDPCTPLFLCALETSYSDGCSTRVWNNWFQEVINL